MILQSEELTTQNIDQEIAVTRGDVLRLKIETDSAIDYSSIDVTTNSYYTEAESGQQIFDDETNEPLFILPLFFDANIYKPVNMTSPQSSWNAGTGGDFNIQVVINDAQALTDDELVLTVKSDSRKIIKQTINLTEIDPVTRVAGLKFTLEKGKDYFFDVSTGSTRVNINNAVSTVRGYYPVPNQQDEPSYISLPYGLFQSIESKGIPSKPYRGWSIVAYNGNKERKGEPIIEGDLVIPPGITDPSTLKSYALFPNQSDKKWYGPASDIWYGKDSLSASRLGADYIPPFNLDDGYDSRAVGSSIDSEQFTLGKGHIAFIHTKTTADPGSGTGEPETTNYSEMLDMNGDQFPDVVMNGKVQFTLPDGGLEEEASAQILPLGIWGSGYWARGVGTAGSIPTSNPVNMVKGKVKHYKAMFGGNGSFTGGTSSSAGSTTNSGSGDTGGENSDGDGLELPALGISGDINTSKNWMKFRLLDINGDGLPDQVYQRDGIIYVMLNYGYSLSGSWEIWGSGGINESESKNSSFSYSVGYNYDGFGFSGGKTTTSAKSWTGFTLRDINGDGLPDALLRSDAGLLVRLNTGTGFSQDTLKWKGGVVGEKEKTINYQRSYSDGTGYSYSYAYDTGYFVQIIVNIGDFSTDSMSRTKVTLKDIDGDGLLDQLVSGTNDSELSVSRNRVGRTNLLKQVKRPLGSTIDIDYKRTGNTYAQPQSRWVMSKVTVFDGVEDAVTGEGSDHQITKYIYEDGYHDRLERDFYGFGKVTQQAFASDTADKPYRSVIQRVSH